MYNTTVNAHADSTVVLVILSSASVLSTFERKTSAIASTSTIASLVGLVLVQ